MKLKQRFFDKTVFGKDITRFAPAWGLYLIGMLAFLLTAVSDSLSRNNNPLFYTLNDLNNFIGTGSLVNLFYAALVSQLLFGDLFNSRLCNALHALPLRRECWFTTHLAAGLLFSLVPNLVVSLCLTPLLGKFWYTAFLWLLGATLSYVFYFGVSVFCISLTGNRFASLLAYGFANFFILLPMWYLNEMYVPLLYGIRFEYEKLYLFCPSVQLCTEPNYFIIVHSQSCPCYLSSAWVTDHMLLWGGLGSSWGYMAVCAGIGALFLGAALLLYRIRRLETAGDFVAFKPMHPIFWVLFSLSCGAVCHLFMSLIVSDILDSFGHVFLLQGLVCGFFGAQMLLERNIKVFNRKRWIRLGIFLAAFGLSFVLTKLDPMGITRYVPKAEKVDKVTIATSIVLNPSSFGSADTIYVNTDQCDITDPAEIEKITQGHKNLIKEGAGSGRTSLFTIYYQLENGSTLTRYYTPESGSTGCGLLWEVMNQPKAVLGFETLEDMKTAVTNIRFVESGSGSGVVKLTGYYLESLLEALWADAQAGSLLQDTTYHTALHTNCGRLRDYQMELRYISGGKEQVRYIYPFDCSENTQKWLEKNLDVALSYFSNRNPALFATQLNEIRVGQEIIDKAILTTDNARAFAEALYRDLDAGYVKLGSDSSAVTLRFDLGYTTESVYVTVKQSSEAYAWILQFTAG